LRAVDRRFFASQFVAMLRVVALVVCLALATSASAQDWSAVGPVLKRDLAGGREPLQIYFFPDSPDPLTATRALGVAYVHIEGSAGSASIHVGLFQKTGDAWALYRPVGDLFGFSPRDPQMGPDGFFVTTDMLGPNDPRCCPSVPTRWYVDWSGGTAVKVE
jgi:hypothetical protein